MKISLERLIKSTSKSRFNFEGKKTKLAVRRKKKIWKERMRTEAVEEEYERCTREDRSPNTYARIHK